MAFSLVHLLPLLYYKVGGFKCGLQNHKAIIVRHGGRGGQCVENLEAIIVVQWSF